METETELINKRIESKKNSGFFANVGLVKRSPYFRAIKENTNYCACCGKPYDMAKSGHSHLPFCVGCRVAIIKKHFGSEEKN